MFNISHLPQFISVGDMGELFGNLAINWAFISPATTTLYGIIFATFILRKVHKKVKGEDDETLIQKIRERR